MITAGSGFGAGPRLLGAALAAAISLAASLLFAALAATDLLDGFVDESLLAIVAIGAAFGVPIGGVLGWRHAAVAASSRGFGRPLLVARLATWAVLLGAALVAVLMALGSASRPDGDLSTLGGLLGVLVVALGEVAAYATLALFFGLTLFGLPAWVLAAVVAALWVGAVTAFLGRDTAPLEARATAAPPEPGPASTSDQAARQALGWLAVGAIVAIGLVLTLLRARSDTPPIMPAAGLLGFVAALAGPGLVAAIGLVSRRADLIVAAAIVLVCLAPLSMGGATLPLLIPAVILLYVARRMPASGLHAGLRVATALVTVCLLVAAPVALFTTTEIVCWEDYGGGRIDVRVVPVMPNEQSSDAPFGSGCSSGSVSALGGGLSILAVAGAVTMAAASGRRPQSPPIVALNGRNHP